MTTPDPSPEKNRRDEPTRMVVGIGASAGGLQALKAFFDSMPRGHGLAFVIVQHLDPHTQSLMAKILGGQSSLRVTEAREGVEVEPDNVYTLPAGQQVRLREGKLELSDRPEGRAGNFPIDAFFASLADDQQERAVAVVLSGSGADGAKGVKEVKARGGIVLAQSPADAEQASMPEAAISTGNVDVVAPANELGDPILSYARHLSWAARTEPLVGLDEVLATLQARTGMDLKSYKTGTLSRRILRRVALSKSRDAREYAQTLRDDREELDRLRKDILIGVTSFFRDPEAFAALEEQVVPGLFEGRDADDEIRVWVSGCSTGEEAYSIAMLLLEQRERAASAVRLRIFATDANEDAIAAARAGRFDEAAMVGVSTARMTAFFEVDPPGYCVSARLREIVTFSTQDLLSDPPFPKLDLVCCRNVLIYLEPDAQRNLLGRFHFGLKPGGFLFLGRAESVTDDGAFEPISARWRIFRRSEPAHAGVANFTVPLIRPAASPHARGRAGDMPRLRREPSAAEAAASWLLDAYAPAAVVIDHRHHILGFHGPVERFLNLPRGEAVFDLLAMPKEGLRSHVRTAVYRAAREGEPLRVNGATVTSDGRTTHVNIRVEPLPGSAAGTRLMLVAFEEVKAPASGGAAPVAGPGHDDAYVRQIEDELRATKEDLDATIETSAAQHEELQAANEEMTSMNEELRAANEELMASKEELQSLNEEVTTTNDELRTRVLSLGKATDDLNNLLAATGTATLLLDRDFSIVRWSRALGELVHIRETDAGRPLSEITWRFTDPKLLSDAQRVLDTLAPVEAEVRAQDGRRYERRIAPYRTHEERIEGVFVTLHDVEDVRRAEEEVYDARTYAESIVATIHEPLVVLDGAFRVVSANPAFHRKFRVDRADTQGKSFFELGEGRWNVAPLRELLGEMLPAREEVADFPLEQDLDGTGPRAFRLNARMEHGTREPLIVLAIEDVTTRS